MEHMESVEEGGKSLAETCEDGACEYDATLLDDNEDNVWAADELGIIGFEVSELIPEDGDPQHISFNYLHKYILYYEIHRNELNSVGMPTYIDRLETALKLTAPDVSLMQDRATSALSVVMCSSKPSSPQALNSAKKDTRAAFEKPLR